MGVFKRWIKRENDIKPLNGMDAIPSTEKRNGRASEK